MRLYNLYWGNASEKFLIAQAKTEEQCWQHIIKFLKEIEYDVHYYNVNYKKGNKEIDTVDYGSHHKFFYFE